MRQSINDKDGNTATEEETTKKQKCKRKKERLELVNIHGLNSRTFPSLTF